MHRSVAPPQSVQLSKQWTFTAGLILPNNRELTASDSAIRLAAMDYALSYIMAMYNYAETTNSILIPNATCIGQ